MVIVPNARIKLRLRENDERCKFEDWEFDKV